MNVFGQQIYQEVSAEIEKIQNSRQKSALRECLPELQKTLVKMEHDREFSGNTNMFLLAVTNHAGLVAGGSGEELLNNLNHFESRIRDLEANYDWNDIADYIQGGRHLDLATGLLFQIIQHYPDLLDLMKASLQKKESTPLLVAVADEEECCGFLTFKAVPHELIHQSIRKNLN
jgi:hypothetical protein